MWKVKIFFFIVKVKRELVIFDVMDGEEDEVKGDWNLNGCEELLFFWVYSISDFYNLIWGFKFFLF